VPGYEDITATTESGDTVTFTACAIDIALPARNADGTQDLKFALCNVDGVVSTTIRNALANRLPASLTYRSFISTDLAAPAAVPYTLKIKSGYWTATEVQITAGYMNVLIWPGRVTATRSLSSRTTLHQLRNRNEKIQNRKPNFKSFTQPSGWH
jgi:hypothetical protein